MNHLKPAIAVISPENHEGLGIGIYSTAFPPFGVEPTLNVLLLFSGSGKFVISGCIMIHPSCRLPEIQMRWHWNRARAPADFFRDQSSLGFLLGAKLPPELVENRFAFTNVGNYKIGPEQLGGAFGHSIGQRRLGFQDAQPPLPRGGGRHSITNIQGFSGMAGLKQHANALDRK
jgi:hypothetical protein